MLRYLKKRHGEMPVAKLGNGLGSAIVYVSINCSERLSQLHHLRRSSENLIMQHIFNAEFVGFVEGQRECGVGIKTAIQNFLIKNSISEDEFSLRNALYLYDTLRTDREK